MFTKVRLFYALIVFIYDGEVLSPKEKIVKKLLFENDYLRAMVGVACNCQIQADNIRKGLVKSVTL